ncbi:MAG: sensor domain-containing diguanylate cyclase [Pseudomonadales bacterium]|nr:sensor domain-containing diguanylate cyclase [Pseudomonadales bacterium]
MQNQDEKYQQLKHKFNTLVQEANKGESILQRYQSFELSLLSAENIAELLEVLVFKSYLHFNLSDCRLIWFDSDQTLRQLIPESELKQFGSRLAFSNMGSDVALLFGKRRTPILRPLTASEKQHWFAGGTHVESAAFIPLICKNKLVGSFNLGSRDKTRFTEDKMAHFMAHMGLIAATCLQNMAAQEQIRLMSMLDNLTKVKNRRSFDLDIKAEVARAQRNQKPLSCLFIDADFFKKINDGYGHQAGDETLRCLAQWAQSQLRESDHIARYGGEEFAVLLPCCPEALAFEIAERIRRFVESQTIHYEGSAIKITLSIGVSTFHAEAHPALPREKVVTTLLGQADAGVYDAKEAGRNQVCFRSFSGVITAPVA